VFRMHVKHIYGGVVFQTKGVRGLCTLNFMEIGSILVQCCQCTHAWGRR
jgi:hypothetical protein